MKRRILAVLAAAALTASLGAGISPASAVEPDGATYVALGDSVASGNGILPYSDPLCLQSTRSYPELLSASLGTAVDTEACTAATIAYVRDTELPASDLGEATELVTLTVGVNDLAWQLALIACSDAGADVPGPFPTCEQAIFFAQLSLAPISAGIASLITEIRAAAPNAQIIVTGYPELFGDFTGKCNVGVLDAPDLGLRTQLSYQPAGAAAIDYAVTLLNGAIAAGVAASGDSNVVYADVNNVQPGVEGFDGHGLCDSGQSWISGLLPRTATPTDRGFHPNAAGARAYAEIVGSYVAP